MGQVRITWVHLFLTIVFSACVFNGAESQDNNFEGIYPKALANNVPASDWAYDDEGCRTPDRGVGDCIPVKQCKPMQDFLKTAKKPLSPAMKAILQAYVCGYEGGVVKICCPDRPIVIHDGGKPTVPPPPDVSGHKNFALLPEDCGYLDIGDKIRNGQDASLNEFPWMALLSYRTRRGPQFRCGGSILNNKYILTAAHCISNLQDPLLGVRVGEYNIQTRIDCVIQQDGTNKCTKPAKDLAIEQIIIHPDFDVNQISNDIGLLRVTKMDFSNENVRPVCLPTGTSKDDTFKYGVVTGWGVTDAGQSSMILQKVDLPVVTLASCLEVYKNQSDKAKITYKNFCAGGGSDHKDSCPGDSGGPLQVAAYVSEETRYIQHGIVSFGPRFCGLEGFPGVYTKVAYYMDWILDSIKP